MDQAVPDVGERRGEGGSVVWHIEHWHQVLSERGPKRHLAKICEVWTHGSNTALTFLQGLGHGTGPLEGRFMVQFPGEKAGVYWKAH